MDARDVLPVLAVSTLGPALLLAGVQAQTLPSWNRYLLGGLGVLAMGMGAYQLVTPDSSRELDPAVLELAAGAQHELEHTSSYGDAVKLAQDHLAHDPRYYSKLRAAKLSG